MGRKTNTSRTKPGVLGGFSLRAKHLILMIFQLHSAGRLVLFQLYDKCKKLFFQDVHCRTLVRVIDLIVADMNIERHLT